MAAEAGGPPPVPLPSLQNDYAIIATIYCPHPDSAFQANKVFIGLTLELGSYPGYGGLKESDPHGLIGSGTIRPRGLVGGSVSLGMGFEASEAQARPCVALSSCCL